MQLQSDAVVSSSDSRRTFLKSLAAELLSFDIDSIAYIVVQMCRSILCWHLSGVRDIPVFVIIVSVDKGTRW